MRSSKYHPEVPHLELHRVRLTAAILSVIVGVLVAILATGANGTPQCIMPSTTQFVLCTQATATVTFTPNACATAPFASTECTTQSASQPSAATTQVGPYPGSGRYTINSPPMATTFHYVPTTLAANCPDVSVPMPATQVTVFVPSATITPSSLYICANSSCNNNAGISQLICGTFLQFSISPSDTPVDDYCEFKPRISEITGDSASTQPYRPASNGTIDCFDGGVSYQAFDEASSAKHPKTLSVWLIPTLNGACDAGAKAEVRVEPVFTYLTNKGWYQEAIRYVICKYGLPDDSPTYDPSLGSADPNVDQQGNTNSVTKAVTIGPSGMVSENVCASTIGHEHVHTTQFFYQPTWCMKEHDPYTWEINNADLTGVSDAYVQDAKQTLITHGCP